MIQVKMFVLLFFFTFVVNIYGSVIPLKWGKTLTGLTFLNQTWLNMLNIVKQQTLAKALTQLNASSIIHVSSTTVRKLSLQKAFSICESFWSLFIVLLFIFDFLWRLSLLDIFIDREIAPLCGQYLVLHKYGLEYYSGLQDRFRFEFFALYCVFRLYYTYYKCVQQFPTTI